MDNSKLDGRTVGINMSYLNLGRLPLLAFLCRCPLRRMLFNANWNEVKKICTRGAKTIYMASAFFFPTAIAGRVEQTEIGLIMHEPRG